MQFGSILGIGSNWDNVSFWNIEDEGRPYNLIKCDGLVLNLFEMGSKLVICSSIGLNQISDFIMHNHQKIPSFNNISSACIHIMNDGDSFLAGS